MKGDRRTSLILNQQPNPLAQGEDITALLHCSAFLRLALPLWKEASEGVGCFFIEVLNL